jgi:hypothetical protein
MHGRTSGAAVLAALFAWPAAAAGAEDLQITEHVVPSAARTGELVEARVTVTNLGDTATESKTEIEWEATTHEGAIVDFGSRPAVCPPGSEDTGRAVNLCVIPTPIAPGASVTATFSGSSRIALSLEARASVYEWNSGTTVLDRKPLEITGPTIPVPAAPRILSVSIRSTHRRAGQRQRVSYRLERQAEQVFAALVRCTTKRGCRHSQAVLNSAVSAPGKAALNTFRYRLPAKLKPGRYRIALATSEIDHRDQLRTSPVFRVTR